MRRSGSTTREAAPDSRREQAKGERRARIVAAAQDLIRELGIDALSMKQVADRAEVSLSTVYNLFESKETVLARVFTGVFAEYREVVFGRPSKNPLQTYFDAVDIAAELYQADPAFYRSLVWLIGRDTALKLSMQAPRFQFYCDLTEGVIQGGLLRPSANAVLLTSAIVPLYSAAFQRWASGTDNIDEFRARAKFGILVVLRTFAAPAETARLDGYLLALESRLIGAPQP